MPEPERTNAEQARFELDWERRERAAVYATLALADAIRAARANLGGALVEAARIKARGTGR